ncbi:MAG: carbon-nitrogen hydrolase family protein [Dethiobacteria bacterium]|jgi:predicted amidohydrolase
MKLAVCQMALSENYKNNARRIISFLEEASRLEVELVCFPEMSLTGYNAALLSESDLNLILAETLQQIAGRCDELYVGAIIGYGYRQDNLLLNRAGIFLPGGKQFTYDKIYLTEIEEKYFNQGKESLVFPYRGSKIGVIICRDQNYPLLAQELKEKGAAYIFILAAHYYNPKESRWKLEKNRAIPITRAAENKVHVLKANTVGTHLGMVSLGNSLIADPDGAVVGAAGEAGEGLLLLSTEKKVVL